MKRTTLLLGACVVSAAASGQTSTVTIYGSVDAALGATRTGSGTTLPGGTVSTGPNTTLKRLDSGVGPGSRLGFRGNEDLGGGLSAMFLLEMGMAYDTGALQQGGLAFGRQAYVGLQGKNWTITAGRQYGALDIAFALGTPLFGLWWGNVLGVSGHGLYQSLGAAAGGGSFGATGRMDNALQGTYTVGPWTGKLMVTTGNENSRGTGRHFAPAINYKDGPLEVNAAWSRTREPDAMILANARPEWMTEAVIGASYNFGPIRGYAGAYKFDGPRNRANLSAIATLGAVGASPFAYSWDSTRTIWLAGLVPFQTSRFIFEFAQVSYKYPNGLAEGKSYTAGLMYEYSLSKRSSLYSSLGYVHNDSRSRTPLFGAISAVVPNGFGSNPGALSFGIRHNF
jgi:general bacterial porin, GBP family